ncbi:MAG: hypothetical protein U0556_08010 [Dehalococcoidia bacterium]
MENRTFEEELRRVGAEIDRLVANARTWFDELTGSPSARRRSASSASSAIGLAIAGKRFKPEVERALKDIEQALNSLSTPRTPAADQPETSEPPP